MVDENAIDLAAEVVHRVCEGSRYQPVRFLGRGGMGQVWVVRQGLLKREFALKILHPRFGLKPQVTDRLRLEAQAAGRLEHTGVVQVIDFWISSDGHACYVMELLHGRNLEQELRVRRRLPAAEVVEIGCQTLSALAAAHRLGVIHRDIKPDNLFLHELPGIGQIVKVLDFGLARVVDDYAERTPAPPMQKTRTGVAIGTPRFMSPEAAEGKPVDQRSDLYSLGLTLFEALTGRGPFDSPTDGAIPPPSAFVDGIPAGLDLSIVMSLEPNPSKRFQTALDFESVLRQVFPVRRTLRSR